jgi:hypothetical protein
MLKYNILQVSNVVPKATGLRDNPALEGPEVKMLLLYLKHLLGCVIPSVSSLMEEKSCGQSSL